jgi:hypothetical protein
MRALLYVNYMGKLHKSGDLEVPDGVMVLDIMPDPRMAQFKIFGVNTQMPPLKFYRITGADEIFEGAVFVSKINEPLHETGQSV